MGGKPITVTCPRCGAENIRVLPAIFKGIPAWATRRYLVLHNWPGSDAECFQVQAPNAPRKHRKSK